MANTGYKEYLQRQLMDAATGLPIDPQVKEANVNDANYVPPVLDLTMCPTSVTVYSRLLQPTGSGIPCGSAGGSSTYYLDNNGTPQAGDTWYTDSNGTNRLDGGGNWWYYNGSSSTQHRISSTGEITATTSSC